MVLAQAGGPEDAWERDCQVQDLKMQPDLQAQHQAQADERDHAQYDYRHAAGAVLMEGKLLLIEAEMGRI